MSTIVDVSRLAGVSKATVSRVINGTGQVKPSTRESVFAAMKQLSYQPDKVAQALAASKNHTIALVLSNYDSLLWSALMEQIMLYAQSEHKKLMIVDSHDDPDNECKIIRKIEGQCDAIVLFSHSLSDTQIQALHDQLSVPLILLNRNSASDSCHSVCLDQEQLVSTAMDHLVISGHRNIACITGPVDTSAGQERLRGYKRALKKYKLPQSSSLIQTGDYHIRSGYEACHNLLKLGAPFSALIAFNDDMALGAIRALTEAGIKVPEQVSVIGIGNDPHGEFSTPELTTVELPTAQIAKQTVDMAMTLCEKNPDDKPRECRPVKVTGKLISRNSVVPYHAQKCWL
ncbi:HTH-type transcriptional regulator AscG [Vibrio aerogenes CECT 7868]|uniref:HTH-type transcriptional regulator AscG n=1 Tax=Vibrio aerogenes CECT 7868 TaxID=1216006 RepID=A0A1M5V4R0_9VIBR|nr:LacI family DNA-binding transcriptional regulator [Vibrio aerogenes]SHH70205.1 HTH-type transcriptional regulator AscG [Vibrio aerogenes CECT 7868]